MNKTRLDLNTLDVQSFEVFSAVTPAIGTVQAMSGNVQGCDTMSAYNCNTCASEKTCDYSCLFGTCDPVLNTCNETCGVAASCFSCDGGMSCPETCSPAWTC